MFIFNGEIDIIDITSGIRHCDAVVLMSLLHTTFRETDAQEMQKY